MELAIFTLWLQIIKEKKINILFFDILQYSDAPKELISPSLADACNNPAELDIALNTPSFINSVGIGYTDTENFVIELTDINNNVYQENISFFENGLYLLQKNYNNINTIRIIFSGSYIGRIAFGKAVNIKTSIPKEPTLVSTNKPRITVSGQVIEGLGGYNYWRVSLDTRYKIDNEKMNEIIKSFPILSQGYPMFISFEDEQGKIPFIKRLYCNDTKQQEISFESSINKGLFSRRWIFEERF
ncbi:MAG: hypothetical protein LBQ13_02905 [Endomicrobium sp.]|nr:hypothetical protein [Endomicrobium sp.]